MYDQALFWYGKTITEKDKAQLNDQINTVFVDEQNYQECFELLQSQGFSVSSKGYQLTGTNDLYQYKFTR